ncbi:hypothetical protein OAE79_02075 [Rhodopirellula sp.]|nr:hypothetical protein [Rhodopirellula sp.]MDB4679104.1 hypothetical protein [Rhodopirellula sp.]
MESTLHHQLKEKYAVGGETEVTLGRYRIDAVNHGELIEVQCASLSAIRGKCQQLLTEHSLRVVKPITLRTRIAKSKRPGGPIVSRRLSPKRGSVLELFEQLIYFIDVFPHKNLVIEVPLLHVEEKRIPRKRKSRWWQKDFRVEDVRLESIETTLQLKVPSDLIDILHLPAPLDPFNTSDLAEMIDQPRWMAQQIAYVLRKTGAIEQVKRERSGVIYRRAA